MCESKKPHSKKDTRIINKRSRTVLGALDTIMKKIENGKWGKYKHYTSGNCGVIYYIYWDY